MCLQNQPGISRARCAMPCERYEVACLPNGLASFLIAAVRQWPLGHQAAPGRRLSQSKSMPRSKRRTDPDTRASSAARDCSSPPSPAATDGVGVRVTPLEQFRPSDALPAHKLLEVLLEVRAAAHAFADQRRAGCNSEVGIGGRR